MFWRLLFILSASPPLPRSLFPLLSQCMCLSWLSFFREMPVYSFVNMTDIMSFLIHHQAQIKTLFWVYTVKINFLPPSFLNLTLALFTFLFFLSFFFYFLLSFFLASVVRRDNHIAEHTRPSRTTLSLLNTHTQRQPHIVIDGKFHMNDIFFIYCLCLWFISKDICHPECTERRTVCEHLHTTVYVRVAWFGLEG